MRAGVERITKMEVELVLEEKQFDAREHLLKMQLETMAVIQ